MTTKFIHKRRELIAGPRDMYSYQAELLNTPGGRREIAKRATDIRFSTDPAKGEGLCKNLARIWDEHSEILEERVKSGWVERVI